jgi:cyclase
MLRKRMIFTLIYCDGFFMQSRNFRLQKVGNLNWLEKNYKLQEIAFSLDEIIVLDASKSRKNIHNFSDIIDKLVKNVFIPISAGGGIRSLEDAYLLFNSGADKIVLNSLLINNPNMVKSMVKQYGSQSILASIDCKFNGNDYDIFIEDGKVKIDFQLENYIRYLEDLGVGELYLNSIDKDGTGFGYDSSLISKINYETKIPLIIAGGAGNENHLSVGLKIDNVNAVATANLFNFMGDGLPNARKKIIELGLNIANWDFS